MRRRRGGGGPVHFLRDCPGHARKDQHGLLAALIRPVFNADSLAQARDRLSEAVAHLDGRLAKVATLLEDAEPDILAFYELRRAVSRAIPAAQDALTAAGGGECGAAFPWVDRQARIHHLENLLDREQLDPATDLAVREQLEALADASLSEDERRERWSRVKTMAPGHWKSGRSVSESLLTSAITSQLGL